MVRKRQGEHSVCGCTWQGGRVWEDGHTIADCLRRGLASQNVFLVVKETASQGWCKRPNFSVDTIAALKRPPPPPHAVTSRLFHPKNREINELKTRPQRISPRGIFSLLVLQPVLATACHLLNRTQPNRNNYQEPEDHPMVTDTTIIGDVDPPKIPAERLSRSATRSRSRSVSLSPSRSRDHRSRHPAGSSRGHGGDRRRRSLSSSSLSRSRERRRR